LKVLMRQVLFCTGFPAGLDGPRTVLLPLAHSLQWHGRVARRRGCGCGFGPQPRGLCTRALDVSDCAGCQRRDTRPAGVARARRGIHSPTPCAGAYARRVCMDVGGGGGGGEGRQDARGDKSGWVVELSWTYRCQITTDGGPLHQPAPTERACVMPTSTSANWHPDWRHVHVDHI